MHMRLWIAEAKAPGFRHGLQLCFFGVAMGVLLTPSKASAQNSPPACEQARQASLNGEETEKTKATRRECEALPFSCGMKFMALEGTEQWGHAIYRCMDDTIAGRHTKWSIPQQK